MSEVIGAPLYTETTFPAGPKNTSTLFVPAPFVQVAFPGAFMSTPVVPLAGLGFVAG